MAQAIANLLRIRVCRVHLLTWLCVVGFVILTVRCQQLSNPFQFFSARRGWPLVISVETTLPVWGNRPTTEREVNIAGLVLNIGFFAVLTLSSAIVVERSLRFWLGRWHVSLAAMVWVLSLVGVTIALVRQGFWTITLDVLDFLEVTHNQYINELPWHLQVPIYFGIGCLLYVLVSTPWTIFTSVVRGRKAQRPTADGGAVD